MVIVGGYMLGHPLGRPGFNSHTVPEFLTTFGDPQSDMKALCGENKVIFGVKMPHFGIFHHYLNCFSAALSNQTIEPISPDAP